MASNSFDKKVMPSARAARQEDQRERRAAWLYIVIAVLVGAALLGIVFIAAVAR